MKLISSHNRFLIQSGQPLCLALLAGVLVLAGCSKAKKTSTEGPAPTPAQVKQAETDHMPVAVRVPVTPGVIAQPNGEPDMSELNRTLLRWLMKNHRRPNNFEDFAATAGVAIPPPPAGKQYVIASDMRIKLVSR